MEIDYSANQYGDISLPNGKVVRLVERAWSDNAADGSAAWFAVGYLDEEIPGEETGPTVKVQWASLGALDEEDDAVWDSPESIKHYRLGDLV